MTARRTACRVIGSSLRRTGLIRRRRARSCLRQTNRNQIPVFCALRMSGARLVCRKARYNPFETSQAGFSLAGA